MFLLCNAIALDVTWQEKQQALNKHYFSSEMSWALFALNHRQTSIVRALWDSKTNRILIIWLLVVSLRPRKIICCALSRLLAKKSLRARRCDQEIFEHTAYGETVAMQYSWIIENTMQLHSKFFAESTAATERLLKICFTDILLRIPFFLVRNSLFWEYWCFCALFAKKKLCIVYLPNMIHSIIVFSLGLDTKQSTTFGQGHLAHLKSSGIQNL